MAREPNPDGSGLVAEDAPWVPSRLVLGRAHLEEMVAHCLAEIPNEGCGLLVGDLASCEVRRIVRTANVARSARVYSVDPIGYLRADRAAEEEGLQVIGVFHSHTHSDPYPSPTDVAQAPDPQWHYVLVSLRREVPSVRSFRIIEGEITEEPIELG